MDMEFLLVVVVAVGFGAYSTWLLATSISERVLMRSARHGRYADLGDEPQELAPVPQRAAGKHRIDQVSPLNSR
jgi:hypothetical protein